MARPDVSAKIAAWIKTNAGFRTRYESADLEIARAIATEVLEDYGDQHGLEAARSDRGIYNDHPSVQAALTAIKLARAGEI